MRLQQINSNQNNFKGYVSPKVTQTIKNIQTNCVREMKFWGGGDFEAHIAIYKGYEELNELMQEIHNNLIEKMQYFAKDCILKLTPTKAIVSHPKSDYKLIVAKFNKELKNENKLEITENALSKIHSGYENKKFCLFRKNDVAKEIFDAEVYDVDRVI